MNKKFIFAMIITLHGCQTLEERMAHRTGCNKETITVQQTSWSPFHTNYLVKCGREKSEFLCTDTDFSQTCHEKSKKKKPE